MSTPAPARTFEPLERIRKDLRVNWYRSPIEPAVLRRLMRRSNLRGALQTLGHLGLFLLTGALTAYFFTQGVWLGFALALWCHGTVGTFFRGLAVHELGHGTVFATRWLNRFFLRLFSLLSWWNHHEYAMSHTYHHRYTLHPDGDREVLLPLELGLKPRVIVQLLTVNITGLIKVLRETVRMAIPRFDMSKSMMSASEWTQALFAVAPATGRKAVRWARLLLAFNAAVIAVSAVFDVWWLAIVVSGHVFVGNWLAYLVGRPMHIGLRDNVPDFRLCVRSILLNPFFEFLYWHMNWHTEHHMFAGVPCYNLKALARQIAADMPAPRSLLGSWREMIAIEQRQRQEPGYQFDTPLPATAHAPNGGGDGEAAGEPTAAERDLELEASIGELAPQGQ